MQIKDKKGVKYNYHSYWVNLTKDGKSNMFKLSRLVAKAFIPNPNNYPIVHQKDCVLSNNDIDNLENTQYLNTKKELGCIRTNGENVLRGDISINGKSIYFVVCLERNVKIGRILDMYKL